MKERCSWVLDDPLSIAYHDKEWGVPVYNDDKLFEYLMLETFQSGLSWATILKKRKHFKQAFDAFDYKAIAHYSSKKQQELMQNAGIVRHPLKIQATIANAQAFIAIQKEFGSFSDYLWRYTNGTPIINAFKHHQDIPVRTKQSDALSADLKKRGFKFVGSITLYAFMQAVGMVNNHTTNCFCYPNC